MNNMKNVMILWLKLEDSACSVLKLIDNKLLLISYVFQI